VSALPALVAAALPSVQQLALLAGIAVSGTIGLACSAQAYRLADATIIAPFDFLRLPIAGLIGFSFFGEVPQWWLLAGASIMIVSLYFVMVTGSPKVPARRRSKECRKNPSPGSPG
jgi:drug/metabolite transporter (DMT)-like permease